MKKITPLMVFGGLWLLVVAVSWLALPGWRTTVGGLPLLVVAAAVGVIAFLKDSVAFVKGWLETLTLHENQPTLAQADELDSRVTNIPWEARDLKLVKKYFSLCAEYDPKFEQYNKERKQIQYCLSMGLLRKVNQQLFLTQAGALLLCNQEAFPHSILHTDIVLRYEQQEPELEQKKDFSGAILETYFQIFGILKPLTTSWKTANIRNNAGQEEQFFLYPDVALTEALVNFFLHRDYLQDDIGYITVYPDHIEFLNPGTSSISSEELLKATEPLRPPYRRNPRLLQVMRKTGLNQSEGLGILRIKEALSKNNSTDLHGNIGLFISNDEKNCRFQLVIYKKVPLAPRPKLKHRLLIVEDDIDTGNMLKIYFMGLGYDVAVAVRGGDALEACQAFQPILIVLDIMLPDIDGYEVCRTLRTNPRTYNVPIIFLTQRDERSDRLQGLELGADDYITKPFDIEELKLRVQGGIRRHIRLSLTEPLTGLPSGALVDEQINELIFKKYGWVLLHISVLHHEDFRDYYGFVTANDALRTIGALIKKALAELSSPEDFLGNLNPTNFVIICAPVNLLSLQERMRARLEKAIDNFYPKNELEQKSKPSERMAIKFETHYVYHRYAGVEQLKNELLRKRYTP